MKIISAMITVLILTGLCARATSAKTLFLKNGDQIEYSSAWKKDGRYHFLLNRDTKLEFRREEIELGKTFGKQKEKRVKKSSGEKPAVQITPPVAKPDKTPASPPAVSAKQNVTAVQKPKPAPSGAVRPPLTERKSQSDQMTGKSIDTMGIDASSALLGTSFLALFSIGVLVTLLTILFFWKVFAKAGEAGWKCLIPIYNLLILLKIAGRPAWWILIILLVPLLNVVFLILLHLDLAKRFGKGPLFGIGLCLLPIVFYGILAYDDSTYSHADN